MNADPDDDAWWSRQPDVGDFIMDAGDAAGWTPGTGWFDPVDVELSQAAVSGDFDDQLDLCDRAVVDSPMTRRRPTLPRDLPGGLLILFSGTCAGERLEWVHGGLTPGESGGWWSGSEDLIGVARRLRARVPDDQLAIPFVISMICGTVDDTTALLADVYRERHGSPDGAVTVWAP